MALVVAGHLCFGLFTGAVLLAANTEESAIFGLVGGVDGSPASGRAAAAAPLGLAFLLNCATAVLAGMLFSRTWPCLLRSLTPAGSACLPVSDVGRGTPPVPLSDDESTACSEGQPALLEFEAAESDAEGSDGEWTAEREPSCCRSCTASTASPASPTASSVGSPTVSNAAESPSVQQRPRLFGNLPESERAVRRVKAVLNKMTVDSFQKLTAQLVQEAEDSVAADHHRQFVESLAAELVVKGTTEKGFVGLYADAMVALHEAFAGLGAGSEVVFKESVAGKCKSLLERYLAPPAIDEDLSEEEKFEEYVKHKTVMLGNATLIGELTLRSLIPQEMAFVFARQLLEERAETTLETLCALLGTVGRRDSEGASCQGHPEFEALFHDAEALVEDLSLSFRARCFLKELVERRQAAAAEPEPKNGSDSSNRRDGATSGPGERRSAGAEAVRQLPPAKRQPPAAADQRQPKPVKNSRMGGKLTSSIPVGIEADTDFQVVRRLIGRGGGNMKAIVKAVPGAKLRIRGRGSGYLEGPKEQEADLPLMVFISCPTEESIAATNRKVQDLLKRVHNEYRSFSAKRKA